MKMLFNQKGSSLVQVMVISGMVSVFGLAVMQTSKNMQSMKQTLSVKESIEQFKEAASNMLMNEEACSQTLASLVPTRSLAGSNPTITNLHDFDGGTAAYTIYNSSNPATVYHGNIRIESMVLTDYTPAKDSANIQVTVLKSSTSDKFGQLVLGGKTQVVDIPVRLYFDIPPGSSASGTDTFLSCHSDNGAFDEDTDTPLKEICDDELGGSYYNGKCLIVENVLDRGRCEREDGLCSGVQGSPDTEKSLCHNLGGSFNQSTGKCAPRFSDQTCPSGTLVKGFASNGNIICQAP